MKTVLFTKFCTALFVVSIFNGNLNAQTEIATLSSNSSPALNINSNNSKEVLSPDTSEVLFEDFGTAALVNGTAIIPINPILSKNILIDKSNPIKVFIQLEGDCNGVYVASKTASGFVVKELEQGNSNTPFSWRVVANKKSETNNTMANEVSNYSDPKFQNPPTTITLVDNANQDVK